MEININTIKKLYINNFNLQIFIIEHKDPFDISIPNDDINNVINKGNLKYFSCASLMINIDKFMQIIDKYEETKQIFKFRIVFDEDNDSQIKINNLILKYGYDELNQFIYRIYLSGVMGIFVIY